MSSREDHRLVVFSHGKESSPGARKIQALSPLARDRGWEVLAPDYTTTVDPDRRIEILLELARRKEFSGRLLVLVGSSMGAYVSVAASRELRPAGLFLIAPAVYLEGYGISEPVPQTDKTVVVHGWGDDVVPVANAIRFAREHRTDLHVVDGDHGLAGNIGFLERLFGDFLDVVGAG